MRKDPLYLALALLKCKVMCPSEVLELMQQYAIKDYEAFIRSMIFFGEQMMRKSGYANFSWDWSRIVGPPHKRAAVIIKVVRQFTLGHY